MLISRRTELMSHWRGLVLLIALFAAGVALADGSLSRPFETAPVIKLPRLARELQSQGIAIDPERLFTAHLASLRRAFEVAPALQANAESLTAALSSEPVAERPARVRAAFAACRSGWRSIDEALFAELLPLLGDRGAQVLERLHLRRRLLLGAHLSKWSSLGAVHKALPDIVPLLEAVVSGESRQAALAAMESGEERRARAFDRFLDGQIDRLGDDPDESDPDSSQKVCSAFADVLATQRAAWEKVRPLLPLQAVRVIQNMRDGTISYGLQQTVWEWRYREMNARDITHCARFVLSWPGLTKEARPEAERILGAWLDARAAVVDKLDHAWEAALRQHGGASPAFRQQISAALASAEAASQEASDRARRELAKRCNVEWILTWEWPRDQSLSDAELSLLSFEGQPLRVPANWVDSGSPVPGSIDPEEEPTWLLLPPLTSAALARISQTIGLDADQGEILSALAAGHAERWQREVNAEGNEAPISGLQCVNAAIAIDDEFFDSLASILPDEALAAKAHRGLRMLRMERRLEPAVRVLNMCWWLEHAWGHEVNPAQVLIDSLEGRESGAAAMNTLLEHERALTEHARVIATEFAQDNDPPLLVGTPPEERMRMGHQGEDPSERPGTPEFRSVHAKRVGWRALTDVSLAAVASAVSDDPAAVRAVDDMVLEHRAPSAYRLFIECRSMSRTLAKALRQEPPRGLALDAEEDRDRALRAVEVTARPALELMASLSRACAKHLVGMPMPSNPATTLVSDVLAREDGTDAYEALQQEVFADILWLWHQTVPQRVLQRSRRVAQFSRGADLPAIPASEEFVEVELHADDSQE